MHLPWRDVAPGDGPEIPTSITAAETAELGKLAAGREVLEVGSAFGYSAVVMALAGAVHVTAVDPHTWMQSRHVMECNLDSYGCGDRVQILAEASHSALPALGRAGHKYGLAFIDGDHTAEAVRSDVLLALDLLEPGGILACHDLMEFCCCPGVGVALGEIFPRGPAGLTDTLAVYHP